MWLDPKQSWTGQESEALTAAACGPHGEIAVDCLAARKRCVAAKPIDPGTCCQSHRDSGENIARTRGDVLQSSPAQGRIDHHAEKESGKICPVSRSDGTLGVPLNRSKLQSSWRASKMPILACQVQQSPTLRAQSISTLVSLRPEQSR
jgi:hypothetical protein